MCSSISVSAQEGESVEFEVNINKDKYSIFFRILNNTAVHISAENEAIVAATLLLWMANGGGDLVIQGKISQKFLANLEIIQNIYSSWNREYSLVNVINGNLSEEKASSKRVGTFFTGGVDSFYTFLKHQEEITDLIFVHGFDVGLEDTSLREKVSRKIHEVASSFGKKVIEVETNLRSFLDSNVLWGEFGHGAALATIGHLLSKSFQRIYIPSSYDYSELFPWGSHPLLDPLWSSDSLDFIHDGCESTRVEKVAMIAKCDMVLRSLRVCWENPGSSYNCGRCEKCLRTMINLKVNNVLEKCTTFDEKLSYKLVSQISVRDGHGTEFIRQNLDYLKSKHSDPELEKILKKILKRSHFFYHLKQHVPLEYKTYLKNKFRFLRDLSTR